MTNPRRIAREYSFALAHGRQCRLSDYEFIPKLLLFFVAAGLKVTAPPVEPGFTSLFSGSDGRALHVTP
jgi:hypothetical protein